MNEGDKLVRDCYDCKRVIQCTLTKMAHVPLYGWWCDECRPKVVRE